MWNWQGDARGRRYGSMAAVELFGSIKQISAPVSDPSISRASDYSTFCSETAGSSQGPRSEVDPHFLDQESIGGGLGMFLRRLSRPSNLKALNWTERELKERDAMWRWCEVKRVVRPVSHPFHQKLCYRRPKADAFNQNQTPNVRLPQELIDAIVDEFDITFRDETVSLAYPDRETLRSCALVAHAFVRPSQKKLFATVDLISGLYLYNNPPDERIRQFAKLLSSKPHITHYVQNLSLSYRSARSHSVDHILSSLPKLKKLCLYAQGRYPLPQPRDAFLQAFSTTSLRRLELRNHKFTDASELDSILGNSVGLKELMLYKIQFVNDLSRASTTERSRVVLHTLEVFDMQENHVEAVITAFTAVDVTHIHSISCDRYHIPLLQVNALSMRELSLAVKWHGVRGFGTLASLKALKRFSITITTVGTLSLFWSAIDSSVAEIGTGLEAIHMEIYILHFPGGEYETELRRHMPILDAKGVLSISVLRGMPAIEVFPWT
ncbi:hypothetical protein DFH07DRAFT_768381 [Mycena maculata]|uniref:F-box domain-containing protein n=1 Tax=Mycena maculata TaxID=230809 RepID=A0AAD7JUT6_9AGAR|nr:hypothetical protein DFH07DRAFT_768381 [Mycena maculata]